MVWMSPGYQGLFSMWWYIIYGYIYYAWRMFLLTATGFLPVMR